MLTDDEKRKIIMLTITESCNLNCTYCYEHNKTAQTMSFETAKRILDYEFGLDDGFDVIEIDLFGGEPFLEFNLLQQIHDYALTIQTHHKRICFATSNGTLIHGKIQEWLCKNKESFCVGLSLDGNKHMHDLNRSNSFDKIDIPFFKECWPDQDIKMTISRESLPFLAEGIQFIQSLGYPCSGSFAFGIEWDLDKDLPILEQQLNIMAKFYISNPDIPIARILNMSIENVSAVLSTKWCGAGKEIKAYDVKGNYFPCQSFMELSLGEVYQLEQSVFDEQVQLSDPKCLNCPIVNLCSTCYGMNYSKTGKLFERDKEHCEFNKMISMFNAYVKYHRLKNKPTKDLTEEDYRILDAIYKLNLEFYKN